MQFRLEITCDNAAFGETLAEIECEVSRILHVAAIAVSAGEMRNNIGRTQYRSLHDLNGNGCGHASFVFGETEERKI